ncbi:MAG: hypothetical protein PHT69_14425 [Bacteroidales bacterium]|nr:hypothetical protein [Bacteroidales bacterium]
MDNSFNIKSSCKIANHEVWLNDELLFSDDKNISLQDFLRNIYKYFNINHPKFFKMDKLSKLAFLCADILISREELFKTYKSEEIGIVLSNASSSLDTDILYNNTIKDSDNYFPSPSLFVYTLPNITVGEIAIKHQISGENYFFISKEFDPAFIQNYLQSLYTEGLIKCAVAGWVDVLKEDYEAVFYFHIPSDKTIKKSV